jgi:hypothetical protein
MVRQARQLPYLNFQISQPYLNQERQIMPTNCLNLPKKCPDYALVLPYYAEDVNK